MLAVTPGAWHLEKIHRSIDPYPINLLLLGKGNTVSVEGLAEQALAGVGVVIVALTLAPSVRAYYRR